MALFSVVQGDPCVRLPTPLHRTLWSVAGTMPQGFPASEVGRLDLKALEWGLIRADASGDVPVYLPTVVGQMFIKHLKEPPHARRTLPPWIDFVEVLREAPPKLMEWLRGDPPIANLPPGPLFEALGGLTSAPGGGWRPTPFLRRVFDVLDDYDAIQRRRGKVMLMRPFTPPQIEVLSRLLLSPLKVGTYDARSVHQALGDGGMNLTRVADGYLHLRHDTGETVRALLHKGEDLTPWEFFQTLTETDKAYIIGQGYKPPSSPRMKMFLSMGWPCRFQ